METRVHCCLDWKDFVCRSCCVCVCGWVNVYVCDAAMCLCGWEMIFVHDPTLSFIGVCIFACDLKTMKKPRKQHKPDNRLIDATYDTEMYMEFFCCFFLPLECVMPICVCVCICVSVFYGMLSGGEQSC